MKAGKAVLIPSCLQYLQGDVNCLCKKLATIMILSLFKCGVIVQLPNVAFEGEI